MLKLHFTFCRKSPLVVLCLVMPYLANASASSEIPRINSDPDGNFAAALREITGGPWTMGQAWRAEPESDMHPGKVRFGWTPDALWVLATLPDDHVASRSTKHNQDMWSLGDVFEVFVARARSPLYLELHVTPNNHRLHLRWTKRNFDKVRHKEKTVADFHADPGAFQSWVRRSNTVKGWEVLVCLPASLWPDDRKFAPGQKLRASFSRYDTSPGRAKPILSSTTPHRKASYHRRHEWRTLVLKASPAS